MSIPQIAAMASVEVIGDFAFKEYANRGGLVPLVVGVVGYIGVMIALVVSLQGSTVLMVNGAWDGMSTIIESAAAYIFLGERFENYLQYAGLGLIIAGLYLLKIPWAKDHPFQIPPLNRS